MWIYALSHSASWSNVHWFLNYLSAHHSSVVPPTGVPNKVEHSKIHFLAYSLDESFYPNEQMLNDTDLFLRPYLNWHCNLFQLWKRSLIINLSAVPQKVNQFSVLNSKNKATNHTITTRGQHWSNINALSGNLGWSLFKVPSMLISVGLKTISRPRPKTMESESRPRVRWGMTKTTHDQVHIKTAQIYSFDGSSISLTVFHPKLKKKKTCTLINKYRACKA